MSGGRLLISTGLRGKVERLMRGDIRPADIHDFFFSMRAESGGRGVVSEIANFIAHPDVRTQGMTWKNTKDGLAILKLWAWIELYPIKTRDVPSWVQEALRANLRRMRKKALRELLGMTRPQASAVLERVLSRQTPTSDGRLTKITTTTKEEDKVLNWVARYVTGGSLFTDNDLFEDFCRALQRQQLIKATEKNVLKKAKSAVSLFVLTAMHNRKIDLGDGVTAQVAICRDMGGNLATFAFSEVAKDYGGFGAPKAAIWLFETGLSIQQYCEPGIAPPDRMPFIGDFEVTPQIRLGRV